MTKLIKSKQIEAVPNNQELNRLISNANITIEDVIDTVDKIDDIYDRLDSKVSKVSGKDLSTNDYTTAEKQKLAGIATGATANKGTVTAVKFNTTTKNPNNEGTVDLGTIITAHQDISNKADKATTLAGYGINDAKIANGTITLGNNSITPTDTKVTSAANHYTPSSAGSMIKDTSLTQPTSDSVGVVTNLDGDAKGHVTDISITPVPTKQYVDNQLSSLHTTINSEVATEVANLGSALKFKGTIGPASSGADIDNLPANHTIGDTYLVKAAGTFASQTCEAGDMIICTTTGTQKKTEHWTIVQANWTAVVGSNTLSWDSTTTLATVGGVNITAKLPPNPNTDTHYTTGLVAGTGGASNATTTNGNTKLTVKDNSTARSSVVLKGSGATTVTSDASGNVTIATDVSGKVDKTAAVTNVYWGSDRFYKTINGTATSIITASELKAALNIPDAVTAITPTELRKVYDPKDSGSTMYTFTVTDVTTSNGTLYINTNQNKSLQLNDFANIKVTVDIPAEYTSVVIVINNYQYTAVYSTAQLALGSSNLKKNISYIFQVVNSNTTSYTNLELVDYIDCAEVVSESVPTADQYITGGFKLGYTANGKNYPVQLDNGKAYVNVPWTNVNSSYLTSSTVPKATKSAIGGFKAANVRTTNPQLLFGGDTGYYAGVEMNANGIAFVNVAAPDTASTTVAGTIKVAGTKTSAVTTNTITTTSNRNYGIEVDSNGKAFVNVPWVNSTPIAATSAVGGFKLAYTPYTSAVTIEDRTSAVNRNYAVEIDNTGKAYVNVPWTSGSIRDGSSSYTLPTASTTTKGGIYAAGTRTSAITTTQGGTTASRYYGVEVDSNGKAFVNVPWVNSTNYLPLSGGTITGSIVVQGGTTLAGLKLNGLVSYSDFQSSIVTGANLYMVDSKAGINLRNSDMIGINALWTEDAADNFNEGINFYRSASTWDSIALYNGNIYYKANRDMSDTGKSFTGAYKVLHTGIANVNTTNKTVTIDGNSITVPSKLSDLEQDITISTDVPKATNTTYGTVKYKNGVGTSSTEAIYDITNVGDSGDGMHIVNYKTRWIFQNFMNYKGSHTYDVVSKTDLLDTTAASMLTFTDSINIERPAVYNEDLLDTKLANVGNDTETDIPLNCFRKAHVYCPAKSTFYPFAVGYLGANSCIRNLTITCQGVSTIIIKATTLKEYKLYFKTSDAYMGMYYFKSSQDDSGLRIDNVGYKDLVFNMVVNILIAAEPTYSDTKYQKLESEGKLIITVTAG